MELTAANFDRTLDEKKMTLSIIIRKPTTLS